MNAVERPTPNASDIPVLLYARHGIQRRDSMLIGIPEAVLEQDLQDRLGDPHAAIADVTRRLAYPGDASYAGMVETMLLLEGAGDAGMLPNAMLAHIVAPHKHAYPTLTFADQTPQQIQEARTEGALRIIDSKSAVYLHPTVLPDGTRHYQLKAGWRDGHVQHVLLSSPLSVPELLPYNRGRVWAVEVPDVLAHQGSMGKAYVALLGDANTEFSTVWMRSGAAIPDILGALEARQRDIVAAIDLSLTPVWEAKVAQGLSSHVAQLLRYECIKRGSFGFVIAQPATDGVVQWIGMQVYKEQGHVKVRCQIDQPLEVEVCFDLDEKNRSTTSPHVSFAPKSMKPQRMLLPALNDLYERMENIWRRVAPPIAYGMERQAYRTLLATPTWHDYVNALHSARGGDAGVLFSS